MNKYFKELDKLDKEFPEYKCSIKTLSSVSVEKQSSLLICTAWGNGEGYELSFTDSEGNDKNFSIHIDEVEMLMRALKELKYFKYEKG